jgi:diguanylate cyclase (GGDEF)-like protein/PAS domain S-box-containing protein
MYLFQRVGLELPFHHPQNPWKCPYLNAKKVACMPDLNPKPLPDLAETRASTPRIMRWGFGAVMTLIILITALSFWRVEVGNRAMKDIISHQQVVVEMIYRMQLAARDRTLVLFGAVQADDPFVQDREIQRFRELGSAFGTARAQLEQLPLSATERTLLQQQSVQTAQTLPPMAHVIELIQSGRRLEAEQVMISQVVPAQNQMIDTLTALLDEAVRSTHQHAASARASQNRATVLFAGGGLAGVLLTGGIFLLVGRRMVGLVSRLADTGERLHKSNLDLLFQQQALNEHNIVSVSDIDGNITLVNDKFCEVSQYSRAELLGQNHRLLKSGQHPDAWYDELWATISAGKVWHGEVCNRRKDGTFYWVASTILPFVGEDGLPTRYVSVRTDITAIKEAQLVLERSRAELEQLVQTRTRELAEREEVLRSITSAAQDAVILIDPQGLVTYWNPAAEHMFGFAETEVIGKNLHDLIVPERHLERAHAGFSHFVTSGEGPAIGKTSTLQAQHRNGDEFPVDISLSAIKLRGQWNAVGIVRNATERVKTEERLQQLATTDTLTGIFNRRCFDETLEREVSRSARLSSPLSLILFDVDHFKRINDTFGHQAGDQVLAQLAGAVAGAIRTSDLFARWGGEEFAVLLPGSPLDAARLLAEKLRMILETQPFPNVGQVTCSFGVGEYAPGDDADGLMKKVDRCLYQAKASGRNRVETSAATPASDAG